MGTIEARRVFEQIRATHHLLPEFVYWKAVDFRGIANDGWNLDQARELVRVLQETDWYEEGANSDVRSRLDEPDVILLGGDAWHLVGLRHTLLGKLGTHMLQAFSAQGFENSGDGLSGDAYRVYHWLRTDIPLRDVFPKVETVLGLTDKLYQEIQLLTRELGELVQNRGRQDPKTGRWLVGHTEWGVSSIHVHRYSYPGLGLAVPHGAAIEELIAHGYSCPQCGHGVIGAGIPDPFGDYDSWEVKPHCTSCGWSPWNDGDPLEEFVPPSE